MSAGTPDPDETVTHAEHCINDGYLVDEIDRVDLSDLRLDDNDDWWVSLSGSLISPDLLGTRSPRSPLFPCFLLLLGKQMKI